jgi:hypothetical protein
MPIPRTRSRTRPSFVAAGAQFGHEDGERRRVVRRFVVLARFVIRMVVGDDEVVIAGGGRQFGPPLGIGHSFEARVELFRQRLASRNERNPALGQRLAAQQKLDGDLFAGAHGGHGVDRRDKFQRVPQRAIEAGVFEWNSIEQLADNEKRLGAFHRTDRFAVIHDAIKRVFDQVQARSSGRELGCPEPFFRSVTGVAEAIGNVVCPLLRVMNAQPGPFEAHLARQLEIAMRVAVIAQHQVDMHGIAGANHAGIGLNPGVVREKRGRRLCQQDQKGGGEVSHGTNLLRAGERIRLSPIVVSARNSETLPESARVEPGRVTRRITCIDQGTVDQSNLAGRSAIDAVIRPNRPSESASDAGWHARILNIRPWRFYSREVPSLR